MSSDEQDMLQAEIAASEYCNLELLVRTRNFLDPQCPKGPEKNVCLWISSELNINTEVDLTVLEVLRFLYIEPVTDSDGSA